MRRINKLIAVFLIAAMSVIMLTSCGKGEKKEILRVGMEIGYPPFEYYDTDGTPIGVDVDLAYALAEEMGVEITLINTAWDGIFTGLNNDNYDCVISAVTISPERISEFEFTESYIQNYQCIVSLKDGNIKPSSPLECKEIRLGYQEETTSEYFITDFAENNSIEIDTYAYAKIIDCFSDLEQGRLDAIICDSTVADSYLAQQKLKYEITWIQDTQPEEFGVCVKKGNKELVNRLNNALKALKENGKLEEIIKNNILIQ